MNYILQIKTIADFWYWTKNTLAVELRANIWYNDNQPYGLAGFVNDFSSRLVCFA